LSNEHNRDTVTTGCESKFSLQAVPCCSAVCDALNTESTINICAVDRLAKMSVMYKMGHHYVIGFSDDLPVVGLAMCFVSMCAEGKWYIVVRRMNTIAFVSHLHSYMVVEKSPAMYDVIALNDVIDHHAVCCYERIQDGNKVMFVRMPYHVW